jgi:hypothetical protein
VLTSIRGTSLDSTSVVRRTLTLVRSEFVPMPAILSLTSKCMDSEFLGLPSRWDAEQGSSLINPIMLLSSRLFSWRLRAPGAQLRTLIEGLPVAMNRAPSDSRHLPLRREKSAGLLRHVTLMLRI